MNPSRINLLLLTTALFAPTFAQAQFSGNLPTNTLLGNATAGSAPARPLTASDGTLLAAGGVLSVRGVINANMNVGATGLTYGLGSAYVAPTGNPVQVVNSYTGAPLTDNAIALFGRTDYRPNAADSSNSAGLYGIIWLNSPQTFTGTPEGIRGNFYSIAQITATVAAGGSGNQVGDTLTIVGGTCNTQLNTPPTFQVSAVSSGAVTAVTFNSGLGACSVYPGNPVTTTSSRGAATPPTLNLTVAASPNTTFASGVGARVRNQSSGTITNAAAFFADGAYNSSDGAITNAYALYMVHPYATSTPVVNDYGVFAASEFIGGTVASAPDVPVSIVGGAGFGHIQLKPGSTAITTIQASSGLSSTLTGSANASGIFEYMLNNGEAYIDAVANDVGTTALHLRSYDGSGTYTEGLSVRSGYVVVNQAIVTQIANAGATGTALFKAAKLTGAPSTAVITSAGDTDDAIGIVVGGNGTTGNARIAVNGQAPCVFDGATTAGHYVGYSAGTAGDCTDAGATRPTHGLGRVLSTNGGAGTYLILVNPF